MTRILIAAAAALCSTAASASNAITYNFGDPPSARVSYSDVDIRSALGRTIVERRIQLAAREVCVDVDDSSATLQPKHLDADCLKKALSTGVSQLNRLAAE